MQLTLTVTAHIPTEKLSPGMCRRFGAPKGEVEFCPYIHFAGGECMLFGERIEDYKKCPPCVKAIRDAVGG